VLLTLKTHVTAFKTIFCAAFHRFVHHSPLKNMEHYHHLSYLSELLPNVTMSDKALSLLLLQIGGNRPAIAAFMQEFMQTAIIDPSFCSQMPRKYYLYLEQLRLPKSVITPKEAMTHKCLPM
jgi:hypothetical protein